MTFDALCPNYDHFSASLDRLKSTIDCIEIHRDCMVHLLYDLYLGLEVKGYFKRPICHRCAIGRFTPDNIGDHAVSKFSYLSDL